MPKRTVIVISADKHSGSSLGLIRKSFGLHDGGTYNPSPLQKIIWKQYDECLDYVKAQRKISRLIWIENGDPCEGIHHQTTQLVSSRVDEHEEIAADILDYSFRKIGMTKGDLAYMTAGTEEHGGHGSQSENRISEDLDYFVPQYSEAAEKPNRYTWDRLLLKVNGVLLDVAHHGGSAGKRAWTTENGMRSLVKSFYLQSLEDSTELPRYWVRSHLHQYVYSGMYSGKHGNIEGFVTPSFQMKTGYAYKIAGHQLSDIGLLVIVVEEDGRTWHKCVMANYRQDKVQEV